MIEAILLFIAVVSMAWILSTNGETDLSNAEKIAKYESFKN